MRKNRLLKTILWPVIMAVTTTTALIATSCSCSDNAAPEPQPEPVIDDPRLDHISISLPQSSISVECGKTNKTEGKIEVICYDQFGKIYDSKTKIVVKANNNSNTPDWIWVDDENKINVEGLEHANTYVFQIFAQDIEGKIKSEWKEFSVQMFEQEPIAPDEIEIKCETDKPYIFITETGSVPLMLKATKPGYDSDFVSKECYWEVTKTVGPKIKDMQGNDVFTIIETDTGAILSSTGKTDSNYIGDYSLTITAKSKLNPDAIDAITIIVYVRNGTYYEDLQTSYYYSRKTSQEDWSVSGIKQSKSVLNTFITEIYGKPVSKIIDDFKSQLASKIVTTICLPESITTIGKNAFTDFTYLYSIAMPGVKQIGDNAFSGCINVQLLTSFAHPSLQHVGVKAFYNCKNFFLNSQNDLREIGDYAFAKTACTKLKLGSNVANIGDQCFTGCASLTIIEINTLTPPVLNGVLCDTATKLNSIKVPMEAVNVYKETYPWSIYKNLIQNI